MGEEDVVLVASSSAKRLKAHAIDNPLYIELSQRLLSPAKYAPASL